LINRTLFINVFWLCHTPAEAPVKKEKALKASKKKQQDIPGTGRKQGSPRQIPWSLISLLLICLAGVIAYSNSFDCSFHFDDTLNIEENIAIRSLSNVQAWWGFVPSRPLGYLSFALNYHFHKLDVWGYHLVNLAIHIVNALLVLWLVMLTMATPVMRAQPISRYKGAMALFAALLFVSHPLATQSVTYIVQRLASLATLFYLLSLALYVKGRLGEGNNEPRVFFFYAGSILCAVLGMLTKEIVFTLPFALVLYEYSFIRTDTWKIDLKDRGIQIPVVILGIFLVLFFVNFSMEIFNPMPPLPDQGYDYPITAREYLLTQFSVILTYIRLFIVPVNQNLDYDYPISQSLFEWQAIISSLSLVGILVCGILLFRRYRLISFGIIWFFLTLSVESSIIPISQNVIFEHRTYLPSLGFFLVLTGVVFHLFGDRYRRVGWAILVLIVLTNTVLTYERNKVWASDYTLWADCLKKSPNKPRPLSNYGKALADAGQAAEALKYYDKAIKLNPHFYAAYCNRGAAYDALGKYNLAIRDFDRAIEINPTYAKAYSNRGTEYGELGNYKQAIGDFDKAIEINPAYAAAYSNRGAIRHLLGNYNAAIGDFSKAIDINPKYAEAYNNRGAAYALLGNHKQAIGDYDRAIEINPTYADAYYNRGAAYESLGNHNRAIEDLKVAARFGYKNAQDFLRGHGIHW
jgi:protein O-mannosyl-transferase